MKNNQIFPNLLDQIDLNPNLALDKYCDGNPLFSLIERIKALNREKSNANNQNDIMTTNPQGMNKIGYNKNNLGI